MNALKKHPSDDTLKRFSHTMSSVTHKNRLADWMIENGFATGHGDTFVDLLQELTWQVQEMKDQLYSYRKKKAEK